MSEAVLPRNVMVFSDHAVAVAVVCPLEKGREVNQLHCQSSLLLQGWPTASLTCML
jgi:hypothetical protein